MSIDYQFLAWLIRPAADGHKRITIGPGFRVDGGDEADHKHVVAFSETFMDNLRRAKPETVRDTLQVFMRAIQRFSKHG